MALGLWRVSGFCLATVLATVVACSLDERSLTPATEQGGSSSSAGSGQGSEPEQAGEAGTGDAATGGQGSGASDPPRCSGEPGARRCRVAGGPFTLGSADESVSAAVSTFELDELEVSVAQFREYVEAFAGPPAAGAGEHPEVPQSGWRDEWVADFPASREALIAGLHCNPNWETFSDAPGDREQFPVTCVTYYEAFAYCAWRGGRLATEAEWEFAAAGGAQRRLYPWGSDAPAPELALYAGESLAPGGSRVAGAGRFGQLDLAGSVWEWTLDWFAPYPANCDRCAEVENGFERVLRGGDWLGEASYLQASYRFRRDPALPAGNVGIRCAYDGE
jgi:formylglycine-generating enzyme